jgi:hypothetical protein
MRGAAPLVGRWDGGTLGRRGVAPAHGPPPWCPTVPPSHHPIRGSAGPDRADERLHAGGYSKVAFAKLYDRKAPITAADLLNDRVMPFFEEHSIPLMRVLTDGGTEFCDRPERHEYELYLAVEDVDHTRTRIRTRRRTGSASGSRRPCCTSSTRLAFRKKIYPGIDDLHLDGIRSV